MAQRITLIEPGPQALALLERVGLPTDDLHDPVPRAMHALWDDEQLLGVVAVELHATCGLLRSLAVAPEQRLAGVGSALVAHAEQDAARAGVRDLYLLTTSAEALFVRLGYTRIAREHAPPQIAATRQFNDLCPDSAVFMHKTLG